MALSFELLKFWSFVQPHINYAYAVQFCLCCRGPDHPWQYNMVKIWVKDNYLIILLYGIRKSIWTFSLCFGINPNELLANPIFHWAILGVNWSYMSDFRGSWDGLEELCTVCLSVHLAWCWRWLEDWFSSPHYHVVSSSPYHLLAGYSTFLTCWISDPLNQTGSY